MHNFMQIKDLSADLANFCISIMLVYACLSLTLIMIAPWLTFTSFTFYFASNLPVHARSLITVAKCNIGRKAIIFTHEIKELI